MKRKIGTVLFVIYAIIAITVTVLLLSFNDYNCSELGGYTVYIVTDDSLEPTYKRGSILIIQSSNDRNIKVGDELLIYNVINSQQFEVVSRTLESKVQQGRHVMYNVSEEETYSSEYCIGKASNTTVIEGWGTLLAILESKWGYLFCIVIVSLLLFLQEVFDLIMEIKYGTKSSKAASAKAASAKKAPAKTATAKTVAAKTTKTETKAVKAVKATQEAQEAQEDQETKETETASDENNQVDVK